MPKQTIGAETKSGGTVHVLYDQAKKESDLHNILHEDVILLIATMHCNKEEQGKDIKRYTNPTSSS